MTNEKFKVLNEHYIQNVKTGEHLDLKDACALLNVLSKGLSDRKKINNLLEGFCLSKGYTFNDIVRFVQERTEGDVE